VTRWLVPAPDPAAAAALASALGIGLPAAKVLMHRGLGEPASARRFLHPTFEDLHDPLALEGIRPAIDRIGTAIRSREKILIYGDYDVDGTMSVVLLSKVIEMAGGTASFHVPHRLKDGYGMRPEVVEAAAEQGVRLIISVDTGIRAAEVVRRANELGIDVIVTDHHLPESELPPAVAVLNPNQPGCRYPDKNLCGAGVAFKLIQGLLPSLGWAPEKTRRVCESFLKLVAMATVADVVPLTGENRVIVKLGLSGLRDVRNPGLRALLDVAGFTGGRIPDARQVAFQIAPRINAAGRMDTAKAVVELFLTGDAKRARSLAQQLHDQNTGRQQVEAEIVEICEKIAVDAAACALVYYAEDWHRGVLGIVASRLVERLYRPIFVLSRYGEDGLAQGSGRSIPAFHLLQALESMADLFVRFGGHKYAAGVTLEAARVPEFRERFNAYAASSLRPEDFHKQLDVDAVIDLREIQDRYVDEILALAPFGNGHQPPVFASLNVEIAAPPAILKEKHLRVAVRQNGRTVFLKSFNSAGRAAEMAPGQRMDVAFQFEEDAYSRRWSAKLCDFRAAAG